MSSKKWLSVGALLLSSQIMAKPVDKPVAKPVFLTCDTVWGYSNKTTIDFEINEEKSTVDSLPAIFTEKVISFDKNIGKGDVVSTSISRVSGNVIFVKDNETIGKGTCSVTTNKKF